MTYSEPLAYSELWYILKSKHIQNTVEYLRWSILLRTLCNYSRFTDLEALYIQNFRIFRTEVCQLLLNVSAIF